MRRLLSLLVLLAPVSVPAAERPSVVLITLDTTRADRMGFLGNTRGLTPALDGLAREGVVFERAYAQAPITTVSHATILSGTYPQSHKVNDFGVRLPEAVPYLPDLMRRAGYRTAAFVGSLILDPQNGFAPGFDRGFDTYDAGFHVRRGKEDRYTSMERRGDEVVSRALRWLDTRPGGPFLLWVHLYDAHDPYDPPGALARRFAHAPYDGEVAAVDAAVGRLLAGLRARRLLDAAAVAVFADHGEALGDRGEKTHGVFLYEATQHVPLILKLPGARAAAQRVASRVSLVDLAPTLLEEAALPVPAAMQGQSLLGLIGAPRSADRAAYAETEYPRRAFGWSALAAWRIDRFLFVEAPRRELYDLAADPTATRNLAGERVTVAERIAAEMAQFRARTSGSAGPAPPSAPDPALLERLAALGYVGGAAPAAPGAGIDPKDKIEVANALHDAIVAIENGQMQAALPLLERVTASDPQIPVAQLQLGVARARLRRHAEAVPALRRAIELQPDSMQAHYEMGLALFETGQWPTAAGHFEIVAARMPRWADARFSLGSVYARIDRVPDALRELRAALEVAPAHYRANLLLGRILTLQRQAPSAVPYLERAAASPAASAEAHAFLADAYRAVGRAADADRARARGRSVRPPGP